MARRRKLVLLAGMAAGAVAGLRHGHRATRGHQVPGGILIGDAVLYDALSRLLLGSLLKRIAGDVAAVAPAGARVLEVGCGPGQLSLRLVRQHGLEVTGLDLDPAMIARAQATADRPGTGERRPSFLGRDRPCPAPRRPGAGLGLAARCPAAAVRVRPHAHPRPGRPHA
jgi:SAM-dependent methyltransferase